MENVMRSNVPAVDLDAALDPASLAAWIEFSYSAHAAAIAALLERFVKFIEVTASGIADDYTAGISADFARDLESGVANALDETRTRIKKPILHAQRLVDGEAKKLSDRVASAVREVEARVTTYLRAIEVEARAAAEAEARRLALEAEARIAEANESNTEVAIEAAVESMDAASKADEMANARALEFTRTRGVGGALTALKDIWVFGVGDITKVPVAYLQVNDAAVRAAFKSGVREVPGIRRWNDAQAYVR